MSRSYRVGVVGFGMAGGLTSYLLAKDGHAVTLLEQADRLAAVGAGVLLQPSGQAVLRHLGLLDGVLARAAPIDSLYARLPNGRQLIDNRYPEYAPGWRTYGVHRGVLFGAVRAAVEAQPVDVRLGCAVAAREVVSGGVFLRDAAGRRHGPFDFVVSGDGSRSRFRAACGLPARVVPYGHGTLWLIAPGEGVPRQLLQVVSGTTKLFGLMPMGDGLCSLYWGLAARDYPALVARGLDPLKRDVLAFAPEAAPVLDFVHDMGQLLFTTYRHVWMPRWFDRHTLFLGDACHAMSPHLGQGINLAMVDALTFARCLRTSANPYAAFHAFRAARRAHLRYYQLVTFALSPFFQSDWRVLGWGRDAVLPWLPRIPWVKRQMLLTVGGLKGGCLKGQIAV